MRQRRLLVVLVAFAVAVPATVLGLEFQGSRALAPVPANLTVLAVGENGGRALFHLRCDPAGGNVAQPAKACAAIAAQPSLVKHPKPFYDLGPNTWYFTISGRLNGKAVHFSGESSWTPQTELVAKLGLAGPHGQPLHLEPPRHGFVRVGHTHTFAPRVLRPGDFVSCRVHRSYQGPPLAMSVPIHPGFARTMGANPGVIAVRMPADGSVIASCLARDRLPLDKRGRTTWPAGWPP